MPALLLLTLFASARPPHLVPVTQAAPRCGPLPALRRPFAFRAGEQLEFTLDALGARAGRMEVRVLPAEKGVLRVQAHAQTGTFFSKIRKVVGTGTSTLELRDLRPLRYEEDSTENGEHRGAKVTFSRRTQKVSVDYRLGKYSGHRDFRSGNDALDVVGSLYLIRQLPFRKGLEICFDGYGIRRLWRVTGQVVGKEHVSLPVGEFEAWHLAGQAVRLDHVGKPRQLHLWISADRRRLPLVAVGAIDLGAVRATLEAYARPGEKPHRAEPAADLTW